MLRYQAKEKASMEKATIIGIDFAARNSYLVVVADRSIDLRMARPRRQSMFMPLDATTPPGSDSASRTI